ncbi:hypothetical protein ACFO5R_05090 [Halosolutus amylolyticus]|uniref:Uncharacterized protein n=1 Tax=Halosolutus amylolyticus TaxID=2932267 RepID=A0ABD5PLL5_9EURY|nr:hypothetical protein [Halosolutus amylolyticus]
MSYLLGFPTPVVEVFLTLVVLFLVASIYLGTRMEGTMDVRETEPVDERDVREVTD